MEEVERAISLELTDPDQSLKIYYSITSGKVLPDDDAQIKAVEQALSSLGKILMYLYYSWSYFSGIMQLYRLCNHSPCNCRCTQQKLLFIHSL